MYALKSWVAVPLPHSLVGVGDDSYTVGCVKVTKLLEEKKKGRGTG